MSSYFHTSRFQLLLLQLKKCLPLPIFCTFKKSDFDSISLQNCIGAIDRSHVPVTITSSSQAPWRNRKGPLNQNVMIACDFDLNIMFISCGWEGSAIDARVLSSSILKGFQVPNGKFYLVDGGYTNTQSFLAPYRRVRYHLKEWGHG
jgi:hypothetical protein